MHLLLVEQSNGQVRGSGADGKQPVIGRMDNTPELDKQLRKARLDAHQIFGLALSRREARRYVQAEMGTPGMLIGCQFT